MAREEKSLTLDELQNITRIQKRYLSAIEEGNYDILPGKFYTRAFIKQFAEAVDLEPEELFEDYKNEIPLAYEDDLPEQLSRVQTRNTISRRSSKLIEVFPKILITVFVIALVVLIWFLVVKYGNFGARQPETDPNKTVEIQESEDIPSPDQQNSEDEGGEENVDEETPPEDVKPQQEITVEGVSGGTTTYVLTNAEKFEVMVKAVSANTWLVVTNNQEKVFQAGIELENGETETYDLSDESEAKIRVGNSAAAEIYVNDEKIEFESDKIVQDIIIKFEQAE